MSCFRWRVFDFEERRSVVFEKSSRRRTLPWPLEKSRDITADIVIVGAGLAGTTAAAVLGRQWSVVMVDPREMCPPIFRAEKIEPHQADQLRKLGLVEKVLPHARRIHEIQSYYRGKLFKITPTEQYGISYAAMVNALREALPTRAEFVLGRVVAIGRGDSYRTVILENGGRLKCRLVVLACGVHRELMGGLGLRRTWIQRQQSVAIAFRLVRRTGEAFPFDAVTYTLSSSSLGIDYVSFFPMEDTLRANLFAFPNPGSTWVQRLVREPNRELARIIPCLSRALGNHQVLGSVETAQVHLYRTEGEIPDGVVLIGDAAQNVCPSTGMGLSKIFTDVEVLNKWLPAWFASEGMGRDKLRLYYEDPRKTAVDTKALRNAYYRRNACSASSLRWRMHRTKLRLAMQFAAL